MKKEEETVDLAYEQHLFAFQFQRFALQFRPNLQINGTVSVLAAINAEHRSGLNLCNRWSFLWRSSPFFVFFGNCYRPFGFNWNQPGRLSFSSHWIRVTMPSNWRCWSRMNLGILRWDRGKKCLGLDVIRKANPSPMKQGDGGGTISCVVLIFAVTRPRSTSSSIPL